MTFDTSVRNWRGQVIGYRCLDCGDIVQQMWGNTCNKCRDNERRHQELIAAIKSTNSSNDNKLPD